MLIGDGRSLGEYTRGSCPDRVNQMGWLTPEEQIEVRKKFRMVANYMCDYCGMPISIAEMPVINPKGGYHKWDGQRSPKSCRSFHSREPKETYHQGYCNDERLGKKHKKEKYMSKKDKKSKKESKKSKKSVKKEKKMPKGNPKVMKAIVSMVEKKPNHYDKRRVIKKLADKFEKPEIRAALNQLWADKTTRKKDGKYFLVERRRKVRKKKSKKSKKDASDEDDD